MSFVEVETSKGVATAVLKRGKVNALNGMVVKELRECLEILESDKDTRALVLTGYGKFFSFGFDIPEFLTFTKEEFAAYLHRFTDLYTYLFLYPKPVVDVADINGFFDIVKCGFSTPRKQMRNSLSIGLGLEATEVDAMLGEAGINAKRRPQTLSLEEWADVYRVFVSRGGV